MTPDHHLRPLNNKDLEKIVYQTRSNGQDISVIDKDSIRSLFFGKRALQSAADLNAPYNLQLHYPRYMTGTLLFNPEPKRILIIGIGGGSLITFIHHHFSTCSIDAVDSDAEIIHIALNYFNAPKHPNIHYFHDDGLNFLQKFRSGPTYDIIFVDGFNAEGMSPALYNRDCFALCKKLLIDDGTLVSNLWSSNHIFFQRVRYDLQKSFPENIFIPVPQRGNHVCFSRKQKNSWQKIDKSYRELKSFSSRYNIDFELIVKLARRNNLSPLNRLFYFLRSLTSLTH